MEWILAALVVGAAVQAASGQVTCEHLNFAKLKGFNGQIEEMLFPCKYWALKGQTCGKYRINLSPGNAWVGQDYRLNTIWLGVEDDTNSSRTWQGRTTNKIAIKFLNANGTGPDLFNKKGGSLDTDELFVQGIDDEGRGYVEDTEGIFRLTFTPWHPRGKEQMSHLMNSYSHSSFIFYCSENATLQSYPRQMCGNETKNIVDDLAKYDFLLKGTSAGLRHRVVLYYDLFMNEDVTQMEGRCLDAVNILSNQCQSKERILEVLKNCEAILAGAQHTRCVASYSCHPMDTFNSCLRWGCYGDTAFEKNDASNADCELTGQGIDLCPDFVSILGNLTGHLESVNCFKDYLALDL